MTQQISLRSSRLEYPDGSLNAAIQFSTAGSPDCLRHGVDAVHRREEEFTLRLEPPDQGDIPMVSHLKLLAKGLDGHARGEEELVFILLDLLAFDANGLCGLVDSG